MKQNTLKKLSCMALAVGILFSTQVTADAATVTKSTIITPKTEYSFSSGTSNTGAIYVDLDAPEDYISNIKVKNSSLIAKLTDMQSEYTSYADGRTTSKSYAVIGLYAKKNLSTTISFDIYGENNQKKESKKVKEN